MAKDVAQFETQAIQPGEPRCQALVPNALKVTQRPLNTKGGQLTSVPAEFVQ